jgi:hypothetical protein
VAGHACAKRIAVRVLCVPPVDIAYAMHIVNITSDQLPRHWFQLKMSEGNMLTIKLAIKGNGSILMHNPTSMRRTQDERGGKKIPLAYDEAKAGLYALPSGQLYIKSDAFREAALIAAASWKDPQARGRQMMTRRFAASVFLATETCPLFRQSNGKKITSADEDWEIDERRCIVQKQGIIRARPKISDWQCELEFEYDEALIVPPLIVGIVETSGKYPGVLDYRVGKKGPFGRYFAALANGHDTKKRGK